MTNKPRESRVGLSKVDFYHDDWLAGTMELSAEQRGVFITLCALYWSKSARVPENDQWLAGMCSMSVRKWKIVKQQLIDLGKIEVVDGFIYQERAEIEYENATNIKERAKINGAKGGSKSAELRARALKRNNRASSSGSSAASSKAQATVQPPTPTPIKEKEEGKPSSKNKGPRGSRLSDDWVLPQDWGRWAVDEGFVNSVIRFEAEKFRDYWTSKAGQGAAKVDWFATWRNWMRNVKPIAGSATPDSTAAAFDELRAEMAVN